MRCGPVRILVDGRFIENSFHYAFQEVILRDGAQIMCHAPGVTALVPVVLRRNTVEAEILGIAVEAALDVRG